MKDILIAVTPRTDDDLLLYTTLSTDLPQYAQTMQKLTETTFLLTGPKSFEAAVKICHTLSRKNLQFVCAEVESLLLPCEQGQ